MFLFWYLLIIVSLCFQPLAIFQPQDHNNGCCSNRAPSRPDSATYPEGLPPPGRCFSVCTCRKRKRNCYVPASIAFGHPNTDLSGVFLKPLRAWNYPNKLPFVPKRRCLLVCYKNPRGSYAMRA